ncbi:MAG: RND transporter [Proteobacteria bacterium]|nr:RND transporter [Pseudomonadota bacterium]MBU1688254.1 RND transporter [Pseudomonadota bacterium]
MDKNNTSVCRLLSRIPILPLAIITFWMLAAPGLPKPHVLEKIGMLIEGRLSRPLDIFDLFFHLIPGVFLIGKLICESNRPPKAPKNS